MNTTEMKQERSALSIRMRELLGSTAPDAMSKFEALATQEAALRTKIAAAEMLGGIETDLRRVPGADMPGIGGDIEPHQRAVGPHYEARSTQGFAREFDTMLRTGQIGPEMRAIGVGGDGGSLVPTGFEAELITKQKYYNGVSNICRHIQTSTGNPLPWPNVDDTANSGEWLTEASPVGTADPAYSNITLGANLLSSKQVKYSVQLEQDSAFDLVGMLSDSLAQRLGRTQDAAYCIGDGTSTYGTITGIITALVAAGGRNVLAIGANSNSGNSADTDLNSIGTDDFSNLVAQLDKAYQKPTNKFIFNQQTQNSLRKLKDKYGRPVWETTMAQGEPDKIFGFGYQIDNAMPNIGAGNISVCFGDWSNYVVRDVLGFTLVLFRELYMANYQRAVQCFMRTDAKLLQAAAFSYLIHPLS